MRSACAGEASRHNCHVCGPEASPSAAVMVRRLCLCPSLLQTPRLGGSGKLSDLKGATGACSSTHALSYCLPCRKLSHAPYSNGTATQQPCSCTVPLHFITSCAGAPTWHAESVSSARKWLAGQARSPAGAALVGSVASPARWVQLMDAAHLTSGEIG